MKKFLLGASVVVLTACVTGAVFADSTDQTQSTQQNTLQAMPTDSSSGQNTTTSTDAAQPAAPQTGAQSNGDANNTNGDANAAPQSSQDNSGSYN